MSANTIDELVGLRKMDSSVVRCLLFDIGDIFL